MIDESTYGFSKTDASALLEKIGIVEELTPQPTRRDRRGAGSSTVPVQLRVSGLNFQISHDGGVNWTTWATGEECPP